MKETAPINGILFTFFGSIHYQNLKTFSLRTWERVCDSFCPLFLNLWSVKKTVLILNLLVLIIKTKQSNIDFTHFSSALSKRATCHVEKYMKTSFWRFMAQKLSVKNCLVFHENMTNFFGLSFTKYFKFYSEPVIGFTLIFNLKKICGKY